MCAPSGSAPHPWCLGVAQQISVTLIIEGKYFKPKGTLLVCVWGLSPALCLASRSAHGKYSDVSPVVILSWQWSFIKTLVIPVKDAYQLEFEWNTSLTSDIHVMTYATVVTLIWQWIWNLVKTNKFSVSPRYMDLIIKSIQYFIIFKLCVKYSFFISCKHIFTYMYL